VEKAVDNVENLGFSTAILWFCPWKRELHKAMHIGCTMGWRLRYVPGAPRKNFNGNPTEKLDSRQNCVEVSEDISRNRQNFCEKAPNTAPYDFSSKGNT